MIFEQMMDSVQPLVEQILRHPFNEGLARGILSEDTFMRYLQQDALYLTDFSKTLGLIAARLPAAFSQTFLKLALGAVEAERTLHQSYLANYGVSHLVEKNPACFMYTHYLLSTANLSTVEEAVASVVPCFWIYQRVGLHIAQTQARPNPFQAWIQTYSSVEFDEAVACVIEIMNALAANASMPVQQAMMRSFKCATELEWLFWEDAYQKTPALSERLMS